MTGRKAGEAQMSNTESFIDEVTEEVRKDQLFGYMRRYGWIAVVVVLALVGGTAFNEYRKAQTARQAQEAGDAMLAALNIDDTAGRAQALAGLELTGNAGAVAALVQAANAVEAGETTTAVAALDAVALDGDVPAVYRDLAALKSVIVQGDTLPQTERRAVLAGLSQPGAPFRLIALEQLALLDVAAGDTDAAIAQFTTIAQDADVTRGLRDRAISMIVALGGSFDPQARP